MSTTYYINQTGNVWANNISVGYPLSYNTTSLLDVNGNIKGNGSLTLTNSSATLFTCTSSSNNPTYSLYTSTLTSTILATGTNQGISYNTNIVGWNYNGGTPWGYIGLNGASGSQITYNSTGFYIGTYQAPPGSYKLQIDGTILLNGSINTNNNSITMGSGSITCSLVSASNATSVLSNTSNPALVIGDGTYDPGSGYGSLNIVRTDNLNRAHIGLIRGGNYVWQIGYIYNSGYTNNLGIFPWNFTTQASGSVPTMSFFQNGANPLGVGINTKTLTSGYALDVNGTLSCTNINLQNNPVFPCITRTASAAQSLTRYGYNVILFQTLQSGNSYGSLGITYNNGIFTNTSGMTITLNITVCLFATMASGGTNIWIQHSNSTIAQIAGTNVITTSTQTISVNVCSNIILQNAETFIVYLYTSSTPSSVFYSTLNPACITIR
jgi:hypothetical protein